jgi:hypothetical protein
VWVADGYGASLVHRYDQDGSYLGTMDGAASGRVFDCPHGLAVTVSATGQLELYVADRANHRLVVLDPAGQVVRVVGEDELDSPSSMVILDRRLYVTELHGSVACFDDDRYRGTLDSNRPRSADEPGWPNLMAKDRQVEAPLPALGSFNSPHGIATDGTSLFLTEWCVGGRLLEITVA